MAAAGLSLDRDTYAGVLQDVGMFGGPRRWATPGRVTKVPGVPIGGVHSTPAEFFEWLGPRFAGRDPNTNEPIALFVGHNRFSILTDAHGPHISQEHYQFETAFGDMDTGNGTGLTPKQVEDEVFRTSAWLVALGVPHVWKFSGSDGGFHLRCFFIKEDQPRAYLARWERGFWNGLRAELNLRSLNMQCAEPTHLERLPYTHRVHKKDKDHPGEYVWDDRFCIPVPWEMVHQGKFEEIRRLSRWPRLYEASVRFVAQPMTLENFVRSREWGTFAHVAGSLHPPIDPEMIPTGDVKMLNDAYMGNKECLKTLIFGANPIHRVRLAWALEMLATGLSRDEALSHCNQVGKSAAAGLGWQDYAPEVCAQHIDQIWRHEPKYEPQGCKRLLEEEVCIGPRCPLYRLSFPKMWREHLIQHPLDQNHDRCQNPDVSLAAVTVEEIDDLLMEGV